MKYLKALFFVSICFLTLQAHAQFKNLIKDSVYSSILGETRNLLIYVPNDVAEKRDSITKYPVVYVLDGATHFLAVSGIVNELAETSYSNVLPKMIVVCITNTKRTRDLTPYPVGKSYFIEEKMSKETGGAENFTECIEKEIIPFINSKYPATNYRALVGHSFGGIFALNVLAKHKDLFEDYIVIDPSTWYDDRKFAHHVIDSLSKNNYTGKSLYLAVANTANQTNTSKVKFLKEPFSEHEKSIFEFNKRVKGIKNNHLAFESKFYSNDDHQSVPVAAIYDGLRFFFKNYRFSIEKVNDPSFIPSRDLPGFYKKLSQKIQFETKIPSDVLEGSDMYYNLFKDEKRKQEIRAMYENLYPEKASKYYKAQKKS